MSEALEKVKNYQEVRAIKRLLIEEIHHDLFSTFDAPSIWENTDQSKAYNSAIADMKHHGVSIRGGADD